MISPILQSRNRGQFARACAFACASALLLAGTANAALIQTTLWDFSGEDARMSLTIDDMTTPGSLVITLSVVDPIGDIRGLWLNVTDESLLAGLIATGDDVTSAVFGANAVGNLAGGATITGSGSPCPCDIGIAIGTPGIGQDDIQTTTVTLSHATASLSVSLLDGERAGARLTSILDTSSKSKGKKKKDREGSSKLKGGLKIVPEPGTLTLALLGLTGLAIGSRPRRPRRQG